MALELALVVLAMHRTLCGHEQMVEEKLDRLRLPSVRWVVKARLTAGVLYNVFDAAYRRRPGKNLPFYFIVDEAQEIGSGMT